MDSLEKFERLAQGDFRYYSCLIWLWWSLIFSSFTLPILVVVSLYISTSVVHLFQLKQYFKTGELLVLNGEFKARARTVLATVWNFHGRVWHGYEVIGMENIPKEGPALLVYYHGPIPVDYYYFIARYFIDTKRVMWTIAAACLFKTTGLRSLLDVIQAIPGSVQQVSDLLKRGHVVSVAPGGIREAQFSDGHYKLVWNGHLGFAKAACQGEAPIIPVFTQNIREAFRPIPFLQGLFRTIYERTRLPLTPIYGGFPVKLRAIVGKPIPYDEKASPEEVAERTSQALKCLIEQHQSMPGTVIGAMLDRLK